ncbi:MAG: hypothetical protein ACREK4_00105 [Candidatus Rokuibacteriota bacterium]
MLAKVYQSANLNYRLYDGSQVFFHSYLVAPPRIYMEEVWTILTMFHSASVTPVAENTIKLVATMKITDDGGANVTVWEFDGLTGLLIRKSVSTTAQINMQRAKVSLGGVLYAKYSDLHIRQCDPSTIDPPVGGGVDYPPDYWSPTHQILDPYAFGFDEYTNRAVMHTSEDYNTEVSIYELSSGNQLGKVHGCGMIDDITMESVGHAYILHTNGVVSVLDYLRKEIIGVFRVPGDWNIFNGTFAWDPVYKRILHVFNSASAVDGASTVSVKGYANLPVATNITPPLPLKAPRLGRFVPVAVRAYGDAGEPIPAQIIDAARTGAGTLTPANVTADEFGYAIFSHDCSAEGSVTIDAQATL